MALYGHFDVVIFILLVAAPHLPQTKCADPDPLQDYCVADTNSTVLVNGVPCINATTVVASHFKTSALGIPTNTSGNGSLGFGATFTTVNNMPGINTQGLAIVRTDFALGGVVPPHAHPRASEMTFIIKGSLLAGFVDTSNKLFSQKLEAGDAFMFPRGLLHFIQNVGNSTGLSISAFNSQNPGVIVLPQATFATKPPIPSPVLEKAFQISAQEAQTIRKNLGG